MLVKTPLREDAMREDGTCEDAMREDGMCRGMLCKDGLRACGSGGPLWLREDGGCRVSENSHNVHVSFIDHEAMCFVKLCWVRR